MSVVVAVPLFAASIAVTLTASATFAKRLDRLGFKYGLPEVWIGLLTAAAADGPEVSSALAALLKGAHSASTGVIVGSNVFNLAAMIGISALVFGPVRISRNTLLVEGTVAIAISAIVIALLLGWIPAFAAVIGVTLFLAPYLLLVVGSDHLVRRLGGDRLAATLKDRDSHDRQAEEVQPLSNEFRTHRQIGLMLLDIAMIVAGSFGMVQAALTLGDRWGITSAVVGALILGPLTSLPNALTGIRLGQAGRGAALVTEALNSNTINLVAGVAIPSLFVTITSRSTEDRIDLALLAAATVAVVAWLARGKGVGRLAAGLIVAVYAAFVVVTLS